jgi:hypothetical protein
MLRIFHVPPIQLPSNPGARERKILKLAPMDHLPPGRKGAGNRNLIK